MIDQLEAIAAAKARSRAQDWAGAAAGWQMVVDVNPVNGTYQDRLGEACFALGDYSEALSAYQRALELGVWGEDYGEETSSVFPGEVAYRVARCHARLGDRERAVAALTGAVRSGLRDLERLSTDEHLSSLRGDPRFEMLCWPAVPPDVSRVEGWRTDLRLLQREVRRRAPDPDPGFDAAVAELDAALPELDDMQVVVGLWRLLRLLGDGHAGIVTSSLPRRWQHCLPVWCFGFAEGLFVTAAEPGYAQLLGAQVLAFDGHPVNEVIAALDPFLTRDNEYGGAAKAPHRLRLPAFLHAVGVAEGPNKVTLTVRLGDTSVVDVTLPAESQLTTPDQIRGLPESRWLPDTLPGPLPAYLRALDTRYWFEHRHDPELVYFQFNGIGDLPEEPLAAFYERLFGYLRVHDIGRLVIDLRWNGGGDTFLAMPLVHHVISHDRINRRGNLFVITGRHTFSAAQNLTTLLDRHTNALFVGEPSGSRPNAVGEFVPFHLPYSRLQVNFGDLYWQTSWPFDRRQAIAPHIYAPPTYAVFAANRDPAMEAILQTIPTNDG